jgi:aminoglycoside phosphotransferase (APT) family kinase protein
LDIEQPAQLLAYLRSRGLVGLTEEAALTPLTGGVSNRVVLVQRAGGEAWVVKQALEKLRVAVEWHSSPARIHREALGLRWLEKLAPAGAITPLVDEDHEQHLLIMQAVQQPHTNWKSLLLSGHVQAGHIAQFGTLLGTIHRDATRLPELAAVFADASFFESLRLEPYYAYSATQAPEAADFLHALMVATGARRCTLVHGDYSPKNVLVWQDRLVLLDHEVIHWGDPAFDLGFSLTHLLSKAHHLPQYRQDFTRGALQYWQSYLATVGDVAWLAELEMWAVRHTIACLLARVVGRSPLEYLDGAQRNRQRAAALALIRQELTSIPGLIEQFVDRIAANANY